MEQTSLAKTMCNIPEQAVVSVIDQVVSDRPWLLAPLRNAFTEKQDERDEEIALRKVLVFTTDGSVGEHFIDTNPVRNYAEVSPTCLSLLCVDSCITNSKTCHADSESFRQCNKY